MYLLPTVKKIPQSQFLEADTSRSRSSFLGWGGFSFAPGLLPANTKPQDVSLSLKMVNIF
jgi:hypothetical protein